MDERFAKIATDPRFRRPAKKHTKLAVDERFADMFDGKTSAAFTRPVAVDKYGRKIRDRKANKELKRFYRLEQEERQDDAGKTSSSEEDNSTQSSTASESEDTLVAERAFSSHPLVDSNVPLGDATHRLAIVNLDWDQIKAVDLYVLLHGFKPSSGVIHAVTIYPSQFGKERMTREALEGPPKELFTKQQASACEDSGSDGTDDGKLSDGDDEGHDFDSLQLRRYQLDRLRYFYAVVECDSVMTAQALYTECDTREFETSANFLDLRYIPDDVTFSEDEAHDQAGRLPKEGEYRPKADLVTAALQKTKVKLTWDEDDVDRRRLIQTDFDKLEHDDLEAYLASNSSEDEHADAANVRKLLLHPGENVFGRKSRQDAEGELSIEFKSGFNVDEDVDKEATFDAEELLTAAKDNETAEDDDSKNKTPFEKYIRRRVEKKRAKKSAREVAKTAFEEQQRSVLKSRKKRSGELEEDEIKQQANLELIMMDNKKSEKKHFSMDRLVSLKKKSKKRTEDSFEVDVKDERFCAVFEDAEYAINPTDSQYKPTPGMSTILHERQQRYVARMKSKCETTPRRQ